MKTVNKKFGVYAVVLGVAGIWLAWDKVGGNASQAAAAVETPAAAVAADATPETAIEGNMPSIALRLAEVCKARGVDVTKVNGLRDAFRPSQSWMPQAKAATATAFDVAGFKSQHKLTMILTGRVPHAMIDNRMVKIGEDAGGFKLAAVRKTSAVVSVAGRMVELPLEQ